MMVQSDDATEPYYRIMIYSYTVTTFSSCSMCTMLMHHATARG